MIALIIIIYLIMRDNNIVNLLLNKMTDYHVVYTFTNDPIRLLRVKFVMMGKLLECIKFMWVNWSSAKQTELG